MDNRLSENFCLAMDQLIAKRLSGLSYNITRTCEIVDISKKKEGKYKVREGASIFEAFSDKTEYSIGDIVQVLIPNGDYDEQKIIQGKKIAENSEPYIFESPMSQILTLKEIAPNVQLSLLTDGQYPSITKSLIFDINIAKVNSMVISADFKAWLSQYNLIKGSYGIKLYLYSLPENKEKYRIDEFTLDSSEMIGNPYNFGSYFNQQKIFDISDLNDIKKGEIVFYQGGNFQDYTGKPIPKLVDFDGNLLPDNLFMQNLHLCFGFLNKNYKEDTVSLFSKNTKNYSNSLNQKDSNKKSIELRWIHNNNGRLEFINTDNFDKTKYQIQWYRYIRGDIEHGDEYCGPHWTQWNEDIKEKDSIFYRILNPDITKGSERIKAICFILNKSVDSENKEIIVKQPIYSNELIFNNDSEVPNEATITQITGLDFIITNSDGMQCTNNFFAYNQEGYILENYAGKYYNIEARFKGQKISTTLDSDDTQKVESIVWEILNNSQQIYFLKNANNLGKAVFRLNSTYNETLNSCSVKCTVMLDNIKYTQLCILNFGIQGTNGTEQTFILDFENNEQKGFLLDENAPTSLIVKPYLYNTNGERIELNDSCHIVWGWRGKSGEHLVSSCMTIEENQSNKDQCVITLDKNRWNKNGNYSVLQAVLKGAPSLENQKSYDLIAYLPIPIHYKKYCNISGPTTIIYNYMGKPRYRQAPLYLYNELGEKKKNISWTINLYDKTVSDNPKIIQLPTKEYSITVPETFLDNYYYEAELKAFINDKVVWSQPLLIFQNKYGISMLNSWNGDLTLDEKNGTILSTMLSAGSKDKSNKYSGVLIGDMHKATGGTDAILTGIYGFDHGVCSYSLTQDGKACFGVAGAGQIILNGSSGIIKSGNYNSKNSGMKIDLTEGHIDAFNFKLTATNLILDSSGASGYYFNLGAKDNNIKLDNAGALNIKSNNFVLSAANLLLDSSGSTGYYFNLGTSDNYIRLDKDGSLDINSNNFILTTTNLTLDSSGQSGYYFKVGSDNNQINLDKDGSLDINSTNFTLTAGQKNTDDFIGIYSKLSPNITIGNDNFTTDWRIIAGQKFGVTKSGIMYAQEAYISGNITATGGGVFESIKAINGNISTINGNISTINGNITTVNGTIAGLKGEFDTLEAKAITTENFSAQKINANNITAGTLSAARISGGTFNGDDFTINGNLTMSGDSTISFGTKKSYYIYWRSQDNSIRFMNTNIGAPIVYTYGLSGGGRNLVIYEPIIIHTSGGALYSLKEYIKKCVKGDI